MINLDFNHIFKNPGQIGHHFKALFGGRALPLSGERQAHQPLALDNSLYFLSKKWLS
jgi:hypothetical protein